MAYVKRLSAEAHLDPTKWRGYGCWSDSPVSSPTETQTSSGFVSGNGMDDNNVSLGCAETISEVFVTVRESITTSVAKLKVSVIFRLHIDRSDFE